MFAVFKVNPDDIVEYIRALRHTFGTPVYTMGNDGTFVVHDGQNLAIWRSNYTPSKIACSSLLQISNAVESGYITTFVVDAPKNSLSNTMAVIHVCLDGDDESEFDNFKKWLGI